MNKFLAYTVSSLFIGLFFPCGTTAGIVIERFTPPAQRDAATTKHRTPSRKNLPFESNARATSRELRFADAKPNGDNDPVGEQSDEVSALGHFRIFSSAVRDSSVSAVHRPGGAGSDPGQEGETGLRSGPNVIATGFSDLRHSRTNDALGFDDRAPAPVEFAEIVSALTALPEPNSLSLALLGAALAGALPLRRWRKRKSQEEMGLSAD